MKILMIELCNFIDYPIGGHLSFARNMLKSFREDLSIVRISTDIAEKNSVGRWNHTEIDGIPVESFLVAIKKKISRKPIVPERLSSYFLMLKWRRKIFENKNFDRVFIQTPEVLFAMPRTIVGKVCMRLPGVENPLKFSRYKIARIFSNIFDKLFYSCLNNVRFILATSNSQSIDDFICCSDGKVIPAKVVQFPTRYNEKYFHKWEHKGVLREELNLPLNTDIYVTVGRLAQFKGIEFLLEAYSKITDHNKLFIIIGDGEYRSNIEAFISIHNIQNVLLLGRQTPDVIGKYLGAADVFVMGSYLEGWSTSLVEAVASGLPIVATEFSSAREMVEDGKNGYVIDIRDSDLFASKMLAARHLDPEILAKYADNIASLSVGKLKETLSLVLENF